MRWPITDRARARQRATRRPTSDDGDRSRSTLRLAGERRYWTVTTAQSKHLSGVNSAIQWVGSCRQTGTMSMGARQLLLPSKRDTLHDWIRHCKLVGRAGLESATPCVSCRPGVFGRVRWSPSWPMFQGLSFRSDFLHPPRFRPFAEVFADCEKNVGVVGSGLTLLLTGRHVP
jgi:hypothetical protein